MSAFALALVAGAIAASSTAAADPAVSALKACAFVSSNPNNQNPNETIKIQDSAAAGKKGTAKLTGGGIAASRSTIHFKLNVKGIAQTSFPVTASGPLTVSIHLATTPAVSKTLRTTVSLTATNSGTANCTPA